MDLSFYADILIERFDLKNLDDLSDLEVKILWREVSSGMRLLKFEKFDTTELSQLAGMKSKNLMKFTKLVNLVNIRKSRTG